MSCHWDAKGTLTLLAADGDPAPAADSTATCKHLLDELEKFVAPGGLVAHTDH